MSKRASVADIEGEVYVLEPLGSEVVIDLKVGENLIKVNAPSDLRVNIGEKVWLSFDMDKVHFFDKKTEETII